MSKEKGWDLQYLDDEADTTIVMFDFIYLL
jgi:hypothetical protein